MAPDNLDTLVGQLLEGLSREYLLSIGDSHAQFFRGLPRITVCHLGPVTAFNLTRSDSSTRGRELLWSSLAGHAPQRAAVILSFGEIDLRVHVVKAAVREGITIQASALRTASRYITCLEAIAAAGYTLLCVGVHGSGSFYNPTFPLFGRSEDRNAAILLFNEALQAACAQRGLLFASLSDLVLDRKTLQSRPAYMADHCHLNPNPALQAILLSRFLAARAAQTGPRQEPAAQPAFGRVNIAAGKCYLLTSSHQPGGQRGIVAPAQPCFFQTQEAPQQAILIDLQALHLITELVLLNRQDQQAGKARSLRLKFFQFKTVVLELELEDQEAFLSGESPQRSVVLEQPVEASRVALYSTATTTLHLADLQIIAWCPARQ